MREAAGMRVVRLGSGHRLGGLGAVGGTLRLLRLLGAGLLRSLCVVALLPISCAAVRGLRLAAADRREHGVPGALYLRHPRPVAAR